MTSFSVIIYQINYWSFEIFWFLKSPPLHASHLWFLLAFSPVETSATTFGTMTTSTTGTHTCISYYFVTRMSRRKSELGQQDVSHTNIEMEMKMKMFFSNPVICHNLLPMKQVFDNFAENTSVEVVRLLRGK